jgi:hypothetical protein
VAGSEDPSADAQKDDLRAGAQERVLNLDIYYRHSEMPVSQRDNFLQ